MTTNTTTAPPAADAASGPGPLLRHWRTQRHLTQQDLALQSEISTRHLSCLETGKAQPTRSMIIRLCEHLDVPLRHRNDILLAAGLAPAYSETPIDQPSMQSISQALMQILDGHLPYPAIAVDREWTMIDSNTGIDRMIIGCSPALLEPPVNVLRLSLHPDGLAPRILNLSQWRGHTFSRLDHQIRTTGDRGLVELRRELEAYPGGTTHTADPGLVVPLRLDSADGPLSFLSTTTVFGTPLDVTVAELAIESFFPADAQTADALRADQSD